MIRALLLVLALGALAADAPLALTDEDVVRMSAAGRSDAEIVRAIDERDTAFDLSEEMVDELRLAGVSERVLAAMRARQTLLHPPAPTPPPAPPKAESLATVRVSFVPLQGTDPALWVPTIASDALAKALQLGPQAKDRHIDGVAVFVACTTPEDVPDQWRTRSPLGRDFISMPRHEMLGFRASTTRAREQDVPRAGRGGTRALERGSEPEWLRLDLPVELSVDLRPGVTHDLVVGVAVLIGENYLAIDLAPRKDAAAESLADGLRVSVGRQDRRSDSIGVRFVSGP